MDSLGLWTFFRRPLFRPLWYTVSKLRSLSGMFIALTFEWDYFGSLFHFRLLRFLVWAPFLQRGLLFTTSLFFTSSLRLYKEPPFLQRAFVLSTLDFQNEICKPFKKAHLDQMNLFEIPQLLRKAHLVQTPCLETTCSNFSFCSNCSKSSNWSTWPNRGRFHNG